jgi:hypothetical protein
VSYNGVSISGPVHARVDRDARQATVTLPDGRAFRLRIQHVAGRYYACAPS